MLCSQMIFGGRAKPNGQRADRMAVSATGTNRAYRYGRASRVSRVSRVSRQTFLGQAELQTACPQSSLIVTYCPIVTENESIRYSMGHSVPDDMMSYRTVPILVHYLQYIYQQIKGFCITSSLECDLWTFHVPHR